MSTVAEVKPFWMSKTVWANIAMVAASFMPMAEKFVTPETLAIMNLFLRFISKDKVTLT